MGDIVETEKLDAFCIRITPVMLDFLKSRYYCYYYYYLRSNTVLNFLVT